MNENKKQAVEYISLETLMFGANPPPINPDTLILQNHDSTKWSVRRNGIVRAYGANTNQGIIRDYNEDRVSIILNIMQPDNKKDVKSWPQWSFFGVFDGHGGATCSDFLRDNLHHFIIRDKEFPANPRQALINGFKYAEEWFINLVEDGAKMNPNSLDKSGSWATWALFVEDMWYVVNLGDSRTIMSADEGSKIYVLSRDHKPTDEIEKERITKNGGSVYQTQTVARPPNYNTNNFMGNNMFTTPTQILLGPHRVMPGRLSVSRTFGDIEAKKIDLGGNPNVVIAVPDIKVFKVRDSYDWIILAWDGIFDKMSNKDCIDTVWQTVRKTQGNIHKVAGEWVEMILKTSVANRTIDNITVVIVWFKNLRKALSRKLQLHGNTHKESDTKPNYDLSENDLDPEWDYIIHRDLITKVTEVNEEGESSSDNQDNDGHNDSGDHSEFNHKQFDEIPSWNKKRLIKRQIEQATEGFTQIDSSRNTKNLRYRSNENNANYSRSKKLKQRDYSNPTMKEQNLSNFNFNTRMGLQNKKSTKALKEDIKSSKNGLRSSRDSNFEVEPQRFHIPNINNLTKSTNFKKGAIKGSYSYSK